MINDVIGGGKGKKDVNVKLIIIFYKYDKIWNRLVLNRNFKLIISLIKMVYYIIY